MKYLSLFSGIGGFELGIQQAYEDYINGEYLQESESSRNRSDTPPVRDSKMPINLWDTATCIGYSEIDKYAIQVYEKHFNHKNYGDATKIDTRQLPDFDLLVGGFPCQAFSIAGKRRGFDDTRGTLFFDIARILADKKPKHFILENVKGLLSHEGGDTFTTIIRILTDLGYFVEWQVLNAKNFGVPQNRERVFIVGHLGGQPRRKVFPIGESNTTSFPTQAGGAGERERIRGQDISATIDANYHKGQGSTRQMISIIEDFYPDRIREFENISPTIRKGREGLKVKNDIRIRRLTPKECERIMGYPDDWTAEGTQGKISDTQRYKMCGNGIVSNVVKEVVKRLYN